jgi:hypothetical protein
MTLGLSTTFFFLLLGDILNSVCMSWLGWITSTLRSMATCFLSLHTGLHGESSLPTNLHILSGSLDQPLFTLLKAPGGNL